MRVDHSAPVESQSTPGSAGSGAACYFTWLPAAAPLVPTPPLPLAPTSAAGSAGAFAAAEAAVAAALAASVHFFHALISRWQ